MEHSSNRAYPFELTSDPAWRRDLSRNLTLKRHWPGARQKLPRGRAGGVPAVPKHRATRLPLGKD